MLAEVVIVVMARACSDVESVGKPSLILEIRPGLISFQVVATAAEDVPPPVRKS